MIDEELQKELRLKYNPEGSQIRDIQLRELEILRAIDAVCRKHAIKYWLSSGTLLGAVRHGGFIPWDNDVDIEMMEEDYKKFRKISNKELTPYGLILHTPKNDSEFIMPHGKVRDLHSYAKEHEVHANYYKYNGLWVDIFIMHPSTSASIAVHSGNIQWRLIYRSAVINNKYLRGILRETFRLIFHGIIFPILRKIDGMNAKDDLRHSIGCGWPIVRKKSEIGNLSEVYFEGYKFYAPEDPDKYLTRIYGSYEELPPEESRVSHSLGEVSFD